MKGANSHQNTARATRIAWVCDYPLEWMPNPPPQIAGNARRPPSTWLPVLAHELAGCADLDLHILTIRKNISRSFSFKCAGATFHVLKTLPWTRASSLFWTDTLAYRKALRTINPTLVHAWGTERGEALVASRLGYRYLVTIQGLMRWYLEVIKPNANDRLAALLEGTSLRRARYATAESNFAIRYLKETYSTLEIFQAEHAAHWVYHGLQRQPIKSPRRLVSIATADPRKGTDLLLDAFNEVADQLDIDLVLIGAAPSRWLRGLLAKLKPHVRSRVACVTGLTPAEVSEHLKHATLSLLPTRADTSPNAVKESVVAAVPVVASNVGGIPDYVFPGANGFLSPSGELFGFVQAVRQALQHPLFGAGQVDPKTLARTRDYLSPKTMAARFMEAYRRVNSQTD